MPSQLLDDVVFELKVGHVVERKRLPVSTKSSGPTTGSSREAVHHASLLNCSFGPR